MNKIFILALIMSCVKVFGTTSCICTTVPCPIVGENTLLEGLSGKGVYNYENNTDQAVVLLEPQKNIPNGTKVV